MCNWIHSTRVGFLQSEKQHHNIGSVERRSINGKKGCTLHNRLKQSMNNHFHLSPFVTLMQNFYCMQIFFDETHFWQDDNLKNFPRDPLNSKYYVAACSFLLQTFSVASVKARHLPHRKTLLNSAETNLDVVLYRVKGIINTHLFLIKCDFILFIS